MNRTIQYIDFTYRKFFSNSSNKCFLVRVTDAFGERIAEEKNATLL